MEFWQIQVQRGQNEEYVIKIIEPHTHVPVYNEQQMAEHYFNHENNAMEEETAAPYKLEELHNMETDSTINETNFETQELNENSGENNTSNSCESEDLHKETAAATVFMVIRTAMELTEPDWYETPPDEHIDNNTKPEGGQDSN